MTNQSVFPKSGDFGYLKSLLDSLMKSDTAQNYAYLICFVVISTAVTGYFIGLQAPMNAADGTFNEAVIKHQVSATEKISTPIERSVVPATHYKEMADLTRQRSKIWQTHLADLKSNVDRLAEFKITPEQKSFALALREKNRAFNGAPPTVPHPVDQMSDQACAACHTHGAKTESLRIPRMSHQFLANCTQCHVENSPQHMPASLFRENSFVGLPAPNGGPRAFTGAPPQIPHSTWMRVDCMSCHGFAGSQGIRTTHPWRTNCQQCHAPSSILDQVQLDSIPNFLPPPNVE
jgi:cytochrome c-type protein NapB